MSSKTPKFDAALDKILADLKPHTRTCTETGESFEISEKDIDKCRQLRVPPPTTTWLARMRQKRSFMGGFDLYRRQVPDGRSVVTLYDPESFAKFIPSEEWYTDAFDAQAYGQKATADAPFFSQWDRLSRLVPRPALWQDAKSVNSEWSIYFLDLKNGYNCFGTWDSEDVVYTDQTGHTKHSVDLSLCFGCEWCYDSVFCKQCSRTSFSERCEGCVDVLFSLACKNCTDCFGCTNLRNKKYCFLNEQLTEEEYKKRLAAIDLTDSAVVEEWRSRIKKDLWDVAYRQGMMVMNSENAVGDDITDSRDVLGISLYSCERTYKSMLVEKSRDSYDNMGGMNLERCYNDLVSIDGYECRMANFCRSCIDVEYSEMLQNCEHCFGCIGLKNKKFNIFNTQYTEEEYWPLVDAIKTAMLARDEYGEFFPHEMNPIAYNSSHAMAIFPMTEAEAKKVGMRWYSFTEEMAGDALPASAIPARLADVTDAILTQKFRDATNGRVFRFVKPELDFHREVKLALPHDHPSRRRYGRAAQQFPMALYERACASCGTEIQTRIPPTHTAPVLCQTCYTQVSLGEKAAPTTA